VNVLATDLEDTTMKVSADGLTLVFTRVAATNDPDLYLATRQNRAAQWTAAVALEELNTGASEWSPYLLPDGLTLLFCSNRLGDEEIFASVRTSAEAAFGPPTRLTGLGTSDHECDPMMPNDEVIFFARQYAANLADTDIFMARRRSGWDFGDVVRLDELATSSQDRDPWVSPDLSTIYFSSDRSGSSDVFMATR
jgi:Tol biopolymer transport system component